MLPYRQIHLDFHTSECIEGIGARFSKKNFIAALKEGNVNSVSVFAKCHHGWAYFPSEVNRQHPHLDFDLLDAQLSACAEAGIRAEVYVSAGFDEKYAREHVGHLRLNKEGKASCTLLQAGYKRICFNSPYLQQLTAEVDEVMRRFGGRFDGLFMDIVAPSRCYCQYCVAGMREMGLDPQNDDDARAYSYIVYDKYVRAIRETVAKYDPDLPIIHNDGGAIFQGRDVVAWNNRHLELESLPTGGWGYDHFPLSAAYARTFDKEFLGMTGKFHRSWGEFGGFKHPNALRYEAALANACGARCSVGDQLHPDGEMDLATYRLIGAAYREVEQREPWLESAEAVADIGLLTVKKCLTHKDDGLIGANRMMLEGHYLYNVVDDECDLSAYKLLILPDDVTVDDALKVKLERYLQGGGKLLLSGRSGTDGEGRFVLNTGLTFEGTGKYCPSYLRPAFELAPNGMTSYVMYSDNYDVTPNADFKGEITATRVDPYFNRSAEHFCSHRHTPYDKKNSAVGAVLNGAVAYIAWDIFTEYALQGSLHLREMVVDTVERLIGGEKTLVTSLPSGGVTSLMRQGDRLVNHLVYGVTKCRGKGVEVIEDLPEIHGITCTVKTDRAPKRVYEAPVMKELDFTYENGAVTYTVPKFSCGTLAVIEF